MATSQLQSSQTFIRALKAPTDPPQQDGPYKIVTAREAWDSKSFYIPNKGEVISEWILTTFRNGRMVEGLNPLHDVRYWNLLLDILSISKRSGSTLESRSIKSWLTATLNRIPFIPILLSFLKSLSSDVIPHHSDLNLLIHRCLMVIWPLVAAKSSADTLLECFCAILSTMYHGREDDYTSLSKVASMVTSSYRLALTHSANKKKVFLKLNQSLPDWIMFIVYYAKVPNYQALVKDTFEAGIETLFNMDTFQWLQDTSNDNPLFVALKQITASTTSPVLTILPWIYEGFIHAMKRTEYGNSTQPLANASHAPATMKFFASCVSLLKSINDSDELWSCRVEMLSLINSEDIYRAGQPDVDGVMKEQTELALVTFDAVAGQDDSRSVLALGALSILSRIDYDLVSHELTRILRKLLFVDPALPHAFDFLDNMLEHHVKTRTLQLYILHHASAINSAGPTHEGNSNFAAKHLGGPIFHPALLDKLSRSMGQFLTFQQTTEVTQAVIKSMTDAWEAYLLLDDRTIAGTAKRKGIESHSDPICQAESAALVFFLHTKLATAVLSSVPSQSAIASGLNTGQLLEAANKAVFNPVLRKLVQSREQVDTRQLEILASGVLRLQYTLRGVKHLGWKVEYDRELTHGLLALATWDTSETALDVFRALLIDTAERTDDFRLCLDKALDYLVQGFISRAATASGATRNADLRSTRTGERSLFFLEYLLDRWSLNINELASNEQLEKLVAIIVNASVTCSSGADSVNQKAFLSSFLHSAHFWELPRIRDAVLSTWSRETSVLDPGSESTHASVTNPVKKTRTVQDVVHAASIYQLLQWTPSEYFSRTSRTTLIQRAVSVDMIMDTIDIPPAERFTLLTGLRVFLAQNPISFDVTSSGYQYLLHLLNDGRGDCAITPEYISATAALLEGLFRSTLRSSDKSRAQAVNEIFQIFTQPELLRPIAHSHRPTAFRRDLICFVELLLREFTPDGFTPEILKSMAEFQNHLFQIIRLHISLLLAGGSLWDVFVAQVELFELWYNVLSFGRWLDLREPLDYFFAQRVATQILPFCSHSNGQLDAVCGVVLSISFEEYLLCQAEDKLSRLEVTVAACVSFMAQGTFCDFKGADSFLRKMGKSLSAADFSYILDLLYDSLNNGCHSEEELLSVIRISSCLLREAPEGRLSRFRLETKLMGWLIKGTLKTVQKFVTQTLHFVACSESFAVSPRLGQQLLEFVAGYCLERPAAVRPVDMGNVWSILAQVLANSPEQGESTYKAIFHHIVSITNALVRLRRDLVIFTLPHLGLILRQLVLSMRTARSQLGGKQRMMMVERLPRWINVAEPLGAEEGMALARLLVGLKTKSAVRTNGPAETHKTESLAGPFSKHAAYVLKAYIEAMNDPLCFLPLDVRRELEPGLFALCDMLTDPIRDSLMTSALDAGGKLTMKALWKEYEKQKYVGKG